MKQHMVSWVIEIDAESAEEAAHKALTIMRDKNSIATAFEVVPLCGCGRYHETDVVDIDLMEKGVEH